MPRVATTLVVSIVACTAVARGAETIKPAPHPNIILILSDDVGLGDIGCCGGPFKTPHIDSLAKRRHAFRVLLLDAALRAVAVPTADRPLSVPHRPDQQPTATMRSSRAAKS